jgi:hypothetical protein
MERVKLRQKCGKALPDFPKGNTPTFIFSFYIYTLVFFPLKSMEHFLFLEHVLDSTLRLSHLHVLYNYLNFKSRLSILSLPLPST